MTNEELTVEVALLRKKLVRTWQVGFAVLWLGFFMFWSPFRLGLASFGAVNFGTVRAERFEMVDGSGKQWGFLDAEHQPQLQLLDGHGGGFAVNTSETTTFMNIRAPGSLLTLTVPGHSDSPAELRVLDTKSNTGTGVTFNSNQPPDVWVINVPGKAPASDPR